MWSHGEILSRENSPRVTMALRPGHTSELIARVFTRKKWSHKRTTRASFKLQVTLPLESYQATVRAIIMLTVNLITFDKAVSIDMLNFCVQRYATS